MIYHALMHKLLYILFVFLFKPDDNLWLVIYKQNDVLITRLVKK